MCIVLLGLWISCSVIQFMWREGFAASKINKYLVYFRQDIIRKMESRPRSHNDPYQWEGSYEKAVLKVTDRFREIIIDHTVGVSKELCVEVTVMVFSHVLDMRQEIFILTLVCFSDSLCVEWCVVWYRYAAILARDALKMLVFSQRLANRSTEVNRQVIFSPLSAQSDRCGPRRPR